MIGQPLGQPHQIVGIPAKGGGARQQGNLALQPRERRFQAGGVGTGEPGAAEFRLLIAKHDADAGLGCCLGGRDPGGAGADDQDLAMGVLVDVAVGVRGGRGAAEAGGGSDRGFVEALPE